MCDGFDVGGWMFWVFHVAAMELRSGRTRGESHSTPDDNVKNKFDMFLSAAVGTSVQGAASACGFFGKADPFRPPSSSDVVVKEREQQRQARIGGRRI